MRIEFRDDGKIRAANGEKLVSLGTYKAEEWLAFRVDVDLERGRYSVELNGMPVLVDAGVAEAAEDVQRVSFRTGEYRGVGGSHPVAAGSDRPAATPAEFFVRHVTTAEMKEGSR